MIERYSRKELKEIWLDKNRYSLWLQIELAAAEAMEKLNIIPKGIVKKVKSKSKINIDRIVKIEGEEGYGLKNASSRTVLELIKISDDKLRPELFMRKKNCVQISNFLGFNRAQSAVIEAAILVSRLKMLPKDKIINEMKYLKIAVEKTAGPNEKEAWLWLTDSVNEFISRH